jgi:hypothetical protein
MASVCPAVERKCDVSAFHRILDDVSKRAFRLTRNVIAPWVNDV